jgi:acetyl-CoA C-acetyltransferase
MTAKRIAIIGVGYTIPRSASAELSYRELTYEAAIRAYDEAGVQAKDIQCFTTCAEDFNEGTSIFDEYVPDQLGAPLKPVHTISGDGLQGLAAAYMQVATGLFDLAVVEAHSKASNIISHNEIINFAMDPIFNRPLNLNPHYLAGLEMSRYLHETKAPSPTDPAVRRACAQVVVKNRGNALSNPGGVYGLRLSVDDVLQSPAIATPLTELEISQYADVAVVLVLASEEKLKTLQPKAQPIWIKGLGWNSETSWLETKDWNGAGYAVLAGQRAYKMAGIKNPAKEISCFEIDDTYAYKELQHMEALGLCKKGEAAQLVASGATQRAGNLPVNVSGGSLGIGNMLEATGLYRAVEIITQLRGEAVRRQVAKAHIGLAQSWRGIPTTTAAVVILEK